MWHFAHDLFSSTMPAPTPTKKDTTFETKEWVHDRQFVRKTGRSVGPGLRVGGEWLRSRAE
jgi:hypothetical protein